MIKVVGHRVLIKPDSVEETTKGGIVLAQALVQQEKNSQDKGTVLAVGSGCWKEFGDGSPWCKEGDKVYYPKYSGMKVKDNDKEEYIIVNDEDIVAIIEE